MTAMSATTRLLWRPASVLVIIPMASAAVLAMWDLPDWVFNVAGAWRSAEATPAVTLAFWRFATLLAGVMGLILSGVIRELQHTAFAWALPGISRRLRFGRIVSGLALSAAVAALFVALFDTASVLSIFAWSWLCFALGGVAFDPVLSKIESRGVPAILALVAFRPSYIEEVAAAAPLVFAVAASTAAFVLARREFSAAVVRSRLQVPTMFAPTLNPQLARQYWQRDSRKDSEWTVNLIGGDFLNWLRAGTYEGYGGHKVSHTTFALSQLAIIVPLGYFTDNPMMVVFFPWIFMEGRLHLHTKFLYPLGRAARASLFFLSSLVESLRALLLGVSGLALLYLVGYPLESAYPLEGNAGTENTLRLAAMLLAFAAFSPISHLSRLRGPWDGTTSGKRAWLQFGLNMAYLSLAMVVAMSLHIFGPSPKVALAALTALLLTTHTAYWLALRRHFATRDLVVAQ